ncbi:MAG: hypothetical protein DCC58_10345 [Chloroflexi bacterium]|nr:MAG: hypothetical protein DCC58_10345 [Chloroflexota bacterium]
MRRPAVLLTIGVYLVTSLPYIYGYMRQTAEERFTGVVFDVVDTAQYYAWMRAFTHNPLIANPLTPEDGAQRFFNLQWWLLGLLSGGSPLGATLVYQGLRVVALLAFAWVVYRFAELLFGQRAFFPFAVVMLSSGFGWMLVVAKQWTGELRWPLSVQIAEPNTWFSAMAFPHLLVAAALMLGIYLVFLRALDTSNQQTGPAWLPQRPSWRLLAGLTGLSLVLGFSHGYDLLPVVVVPGVFVLAQVARSRSLTPGAWPLAAIGIGAAPPAIYTLALTRLDPDWAGVLSQYGNAGVYTPALPQLVILMGLPLLLALPRLRPSEWRSATTAGQFVRCWMVAGFSLLYIPTDYQVKMLTGWQVPVCLLASMTLLNVAHEVRSTRPALSLRPLAKLVPVVVLGTLFLTNAYLTTWRVVDLRRADYPYFLTSGDVVALESLDRPEGAGAIVLSSPELGVWVPVYSDARPYVAHWAQTLRFLERRDQVAWFFAASTTSAERNAFLESNAIDLVLAGPAEGLIGGNPSAPELELERIVDGQTAVYITRRGQAAQ